jgi:hypothetical protein
MGPIAVFDKSFLQMLNLDEAVIFDALYSAVICPVFYTEVLADLGKAPAAERTVEHLVGCAWPMAKSVSSTMRHPRLRPSTVGSENSSEKSSESLRANGDNSLRPPITVLLRNS